MEDIVGKVLPAGMSYEGKLIRTFAHGKLSFLDHRSNENLGATWAQNPGVNPTLSGANRGFGW
jgi:hypothetical protein